MTNKGIAYVMSVLEKDDLCEKYNIPTGLNLYDKIVYIRYQMLEFWDLKVSKDFCYDVSLYHGTELFLAFKHNFYQS
jgi:hypothetical protein